MKDVRHTNDTLVINLVFENGSIANISYLANGNKSLPKEYLEIASGGTSIIINDFKEMTIYGNKKKKLKLRSQDKGHRKEVEAFVEAINKGAPSPIPFAELYLSSLLPFKILESIKTSSVVSL